jgi:UDP-glucose 4-epimerase
LFVHSDSEFANAKLRIFDEFDVACRKAQIELVWSRIFYSFGPGQRDSSLLPSVYRSLVNGEKPLIKMPGAVQDFIYIEDVASALVKLATTKSLGGVFNIGSGDAISVAQLVNLIAKYCGSEFCMENTDTLLGSWASIDKITNLTGWEPSTSLEHGVRQTVQDLKTNNFV